MKLCKLSLGLAFFLLGLIFLPAALLAQNSNQPEFTIAPPPLAYPTYTEPGSEQKKATATYLTVESGDFEITGIGGSVTMRKVGERTEDDRGQGTSFAFGIFSLSGSSPTFDLSGLTFSLLFNFEKELTSGEGSNVIGFVGPNLSESIINVEGDNFGVEIFSFALGFQVGAQYSIDADSMVISPFVEYINQFIGTTDVCVDAPQYYECTSEDVDVTSTVFGFDMLHKPSGVTLSGILQQASGQSDSDVTILQVSWKFGESETPEQGEEGKTASLRGMIEGRTAQAQGMSNSLMFN